MVAEQLCTSKINKLINQNVILEIYNFTKLAKILKLATKDHLVIFDVDDVLIMPSEEDDFRHPYRAQLWQSISNRLMPTKAEHLYSNILSAIKRTLIESRIVNIFNHLQSQKIPAIALTAMGTGNFGIINDMEALRFKELNKVGISFKPLTPLKDEQLAPELKGKDIVFKHCAGIPKLKDGIIFTAGIDKGLVLEYMFNKYNYYPKAIIFIDDVLENLKSLQKSCTKLKIDFCGFHYRAVSLMSLPAIDENLEKLRFNILEQGGGWLSYKKLKKKQIENSSCYTPENNNFLLLTE